MRNVNRYRELERHVQGYICKQSRWGLGHNSEQHINLFSRLYIPPSSSLSLDFFLSLDAYHYHSPLVIKEVSEDSSKEIAAIELHEDEKIIMDTMERIVGKILNSYEHKEDRQFEDKLRHILACAYIIERKTYREKFVYLPSLFVRNVNPV